MRDALETIIAFIVVFCACITTWAWAHHTVATECERLGAFYVNEKTFNCQLKSEGKPGRQKQAGLIQCLCKTMIGC